MTINSSAAISPQRGKTLNELPSNE